MESVIGKVHGPDGSSFVGHSVRLRYTVDLGDRDATPPTALPVRLESAAPLAADGDFALAIADAPLVGTATVTIVSPAGVTINEGTLSVDALANPVIVSATPAAPLPVLPNHEPGTGPRVRLTGRVIDDRGHRVSSGLPVVISGRRVDQNGDPEIADRVLLVTDTQPGGTFGADWPTDELATAHGVVKGLPPVPIPLVGGRLPLKVLLVVSLPDDEREDCACDNTAPRAPDPSDLTSNPAAFSQDMGGTCVDLTTPNRVVEEFAYFFVVRTSEPEIRGTTLGTRRVLPPAVTRELLGAVREALPAAEGASTRAIRGLSLDTAALKSLVATDAIPSVDQLQVAAYHSEVAAVSRLVDALRRRQPGRVALDASSAVDWDDTPTIYQAASVAHGHILQYREVWRADGYSLGDLLYSLPLAPGQKRKLAVLDWERQTTSARTERLDFEEQLDAFAERDRDISEIVGSHLNEESSGGSRSNTWGVAGGIGAGFIGSGFGIFGGVAGGAGGSSARAWQDNARDLSANSLQQLRDRMVQRSAAVRDVRSTTVQTVGQGETVRAETETVANYNHCHAMTVEYFNVLRHFLVTHELADVRECLFVPLPISEFDRAKAMRWRSALQRFVSDPTLRRGFDAIERISRNWVGYDFPVDRYSEEAPESLEGELYVSFLLPRPRDAADGTFQVDMWKSCQWLLPIDALELFTAKLAARAQRERDLVFRNEIAPGIAEQLVQHLRFAYVTASGAQLGVRLDPTLVSRYAESTPLYVTLRPSGAVPAIPREDIARFRIWYDGPALPSAARVIVHRGKVRYRTEHLQYLLFDEPRLLNDISSTDDIYVATPLSRAELRSPRREDIEAADRLVKHLNTNIERAHQAIWASMDENRRYLLLDGVIAPNSGGRSVASVVENRLIGIVGNCLVMPCGPGIQLDPSRAVPQARTDGEPVEPQPLIDLYATAPLPSTRISLPTRGVYAEAVSGECNACERIDDTRFWRWEESAITDTPPDIAALSTASRASDEPDLTPTPLPAAIVNIQQPASLPDPLGLSAAMKVLARNDLFKDITGLEGSQKNALAGFKAALGMAQTLGGEAANLARQNESARNADRLMDSIQQAQRDKLISPDQAQQLTQSVLRSASGEASAKDRPAAPAEDPGVQKAIDSAADSPRATVSVTTPTESLDATFDGGPKPPVIGGAPAIGGTTLTFDLAIPFIDDWTQPAPGTPPGPLTRQRWTETRKIAKLSTASSVTQRTGPTSFSRFDLAAAALSNGLIKREAPGSDTFVVPTKMRLAHPAPSAGSKVVAGSGALPLVVFLHGNHQAWDFTFGPPTSTMTALDGAGNPVTVDIVDTTTAFTVTPNHEGYAYLQDSLAASGYASISIDTNFANTFNSAIDTRALTVLAALDRLRTAAETKGNAYFGRFDFHKVVLVGHSRGGDAVVQVARLNAKRVTKKYGVLAVCSLAPTDFSGTAAAGDGPFVLTPNETGFFLAIQAALDGDVSGVGGATAGTGTVFRHYARATCQKALVQLTKCCHNRFNTVWSKEPIDRAHDDSALVDAEFNALHTHATHRQLFTEYLTALLEKQVRKNSKDVALFTGQRSNSAGVDAAHQWAFGRTVTLMDSFEAAASDLGGARTLTAAAVGPFLDVKVPESTLKRGGNAGTLVAITEHATHVTKLANLDTAVVASGTAFTIDVPSAKRDWSGFEVVNLDVVGTFDLTKASSQPVPVLTVTLTDGSGTTKQLTARNVLNQPSTHIVNYDRAVPKDPTKEQDATLFRLETLSFELPRTSTVGGIDSGDIVSLTVDVDLSVGNTVLIDSITLVAL
ncbi:hypothetical protein Franean1_0043 [Parafrankia sp. EAN1pec]|uniref:alpha/beta hydrolase n=1 Tax=Parafrankia sp. (strain EAN1pec) TaxID=298653 RepID=UPI00005438B8|nr:hypothetical protein Franean1_0043 [Frankia sp. EAN1pec]